MEQNTQRTENFLPSKPSLPNSVETLFDSNRANSEEEKKHTQKRQKGTNQNRNKKKNTHKCKQRNKCHEDQATACLSEAKQKQESTTNVLHKTKLEKKKMQAKRQRT